MEVPSSAWCRLQGTVEVLLCDLEIMLCPHPVLFIRLAESSVLARERQAQGRGRTRRPGATIAVYGEASADVQSTRQAQGDRAEVPTWAVQDAATQGGAHARCRRRPWDGP
jgi:hypothetical protein